MILMAHFVRRGYPVLNLLENIVKCIKHERSDLLKYSADNKSEDDIVDENLYFIQTYCPEFEEVTKIVRNNWDLLKRSSATKVLGENRVICGFRRPKNLRDILVRAKLPKQKTQGEMTKKLNSQNRNKCSNLKCNYCPLINKSGRITSTKTGREYTCKSNVTCRSSNLIYCINCRICKKQYVDQTGDPIIKRFQGHFTSIRSKDLSNDVGRHFNMGDHNGTCDIEIFVLDFIYAPPKTEFGLTLRLQIEFNWIHRLRTMLPCGINTKDKTPLSKGYRNWHTYRQ